MICVVTASAVTAQERRNPIVPPANRETVRATAKIKAINGAILLLAGDEDQQWLVMAPERPDAYRLVGTALPQWLKPGMFVRFGGKIDRKGVVQEPISSLTVYSPRLATRPGEQGEPLGVFPEAGLEAGNLFGDAGPANGAKPETQSYQVAGRLSAVRDGKVFVSAGPAVVKGELAEKVEIAVDVTGLRWLQVGDEVEFDGWAYPQRKTHVMANRLTIRPANPLGYVPEKTDDADKGGNAAKKEADLPF